MDDFIEAYRSDQQNVCVNSSEYVFLLSATPDVMGWHDAREIPNYWFYAEIIVLQDHLFEPIASWGLPAHLFTVSAWSAKCSVPRKPSSCINAIGGEWNGHIEKQFYMDGYYLPALQGQCLVGVLPQ